MTCPAPITSVHATWVPETEDNGGHYWKFFINGDPRPMNVITNKDDFIVAARIAIDGYKERQKRVPL